jgi:hypothetical protein
MWETLETGENTTLATEVPGVGCIVAVPGVGLTFVPHTRLRMMNQPNNGATHVITRDDRNRPPLTPTGKSAAEIRAAQPNVVDPGALNYLVLDEDAAEY